MLLAPQDTHPSSRPGTAVARESRNRSDASLRTHAPAKRGGAWRRVPIARERRVPTLMLVPSEWEGNPLCFPAASRARTVCLGRSGAPLRGGLRSASARDVLAASEEIEEQFDARWERWLDQ